MAIIDHLVVAATDLDHAAGWFADLTGVEPSPGGSHTGVGTRNALVSLGARTYIEIIAPDPDQPEPPRPRPFGIDELGSDPRLVTFAVAPDDIDAAVADLAASAALDLGAVQSMSRLRPDGVELAWRLTRSVYPEGGGVFPFLIDWADSPHPAADAAPGCTVESVALHHPDTARVEAVLAVLGLDLDVTAAPEPGLSVTLATPNGSVVLG